MEVKGSVLQTLPKFIRKRFGQMGQDQWLGALSDQARQAYDEGIIPSGWYPLTPLMAEPTMLMCDLFFEGDLKGAWECGKFSADDALRGLYRAFVVFGSPHFIIKKGATVMPTFYRPASIEVADVQAKSATLHIVEFPEPHPAVEARIGGWMEQGLVVCGCKNVAVKSGRLMSRGDAISEFFVSWA
jgi:hypothetical protein